MNATLLRKKYWYSQSKDFWDDEITPGYPSDPFLVMRIFIRNAQSKVKENGVETEMEEAWSQGSQEWSHTGSSPWALGVQVGEPLSFLSVRKCFCYSHRFRWWHLSFRKDGCKIIYFRLRGCSYPFSMLAGPSFNLVSNSLKRPQLSDSRIDGKTNSKDALTPSSTPFSKKWRRE